MLEAGSRPIFWADIASTMELEFFWMAIEFSILLTKPLIVTFLSRFSWATLILVALPLS